MKAKIVAAVPLGFVGLSLPAADAGAQVRERRFSIAVEPAVVVPAEQLDPFVDTGFGVGGTLAYALSEKWRLLGHVQWATFGGQEGTDTDWTTLSAFGLAGLRFAHPLSPAVSVGLSSHVARTIPGDDTIGPDSSWLLSFGGGVTIRP